jgi:hypothetical protein
VLREEFDIHVPLRKELPRGGIVGQVTATSGSGFSICECAALSNHIVAWANSAIAQGAKIYYTLRDQEWC